MKRMSENDGLLVPKRNRPEKGAGRPALGGPIGGKGGFGGKGKDNGSVPGKCRCRYVFKLLCPDALVVMHIGKGGSTRLEIEAETGCTLWFSRREDLFPEPRFRVLCVQADEQANLASFIDKVVPKVVECAEQDRANNVPPGVREGESPFMGKAPGEYCLYFLVPPAVRGRLIGKNGANIQELRQKTGSKVFIENESYDNHFAGRIVGSQQVIANTAQMICEVVQSEEGTDEFISWANLTAFSGRMDAGKGSGKHDEQKGGAWGGWGGKGGKGCKGGKGKQQDVPLIVPRRVKRSDTEPREPMDIGDTAQDAVGDSAPPSPAQDPMEEPKEEPQDDEPRFGDVAGQPPLQAIEQLSTDWAPSTLDMEHAVFCEFPIAVVERLFGPEPHHAGAEELKEKTEADVTFDMVDHESVKVCFLGNVHKVYLAHFLTMQRYHYLFPPSDPQEQNEDVPPAQDNITDLQAQVAALQEQLAAARGQPPGPSPGVAGRQAGLVPRRRASGSRGR